MKRVAALLVLFLSFPLCLHADEASKRAKLDEFFGMMHMDSLMQQMMDAVQKQMADNMKQMAGKDMTPEAEARAEDMQKQVLALVESQLSWKAIEPAMADMYDKNFTEAQIDDILTFYKSPTGTVMLQKMPELATAGMQIAQERMQAIQPQMKALVDSFAKKSADDATKQGSSSKQ